MSVSLRSLHVAIHGVFCHTTIFKITTYSSFRIMLWLKHFIKLLTSLYLNFINPLRFSFIIHTRNMLGSSRFRLKKSKIEPPTNLAISLVARHVFTFDSSFEVNDTNKVAIYNQHLDAVDRIQDQSYFLEVRYHQIGSRIIPCLFCQKGFTFWKYYCRSRLHHLQWIKSSYDVECAQGFYFTSISSSW